MGRWFKLAEKTDTPKKKIDILKNVLVPKHIILSEKEIKLVLEQYNISQIQLPIIKVKDPVMKAIEAKVGDIIKILRNSPSGSHEYYRRVVEWSIKNY